MGCNECPNGGLAERVLQVERDSIRFATALEGIKENTDELVKFSRQQVRFEERQISQGQALERAFKAIEDLTTRFETRIKALEACAPTNNLASRWVFLAVTGIVGGLGAYIGTHL